MTVLLDLKKMNGRQKFSNFIKEFMMLALFITIVGMNCFATTLTYEGVAKIKGKVVYTEKHEIKYDNKKLIETETTYSDSAGKTVGVLKNNYELSLTVPDHTMDDIRSNNKHGTRLKGNQIELFNQDAGKEEETKKIENKSDDGLIVASQGLHYYLVENYEELKKKKVVPLLFLIPGRLDSYEFVLKYKGLKNEVDEFEVEINNWFLKLFAPSLILNYDPKTKQLVYYKGLSNLKNEKGEMMSVEINYKY
jgi:vacuolar-type H+-ATPase subunit F/Vma7